MLLCSSSSSLLLTPKQFFRFAALPTFSVLANTRSFVSSSNQAHSVSPVLGFLRREKKDSFFFSKLIRAMTTQSEAKSVHDFTVKDIKGNDVNLGSSFNGKALLIVNVASMCGLTDSNYKELSQVYDKYKDKGLEILGFPCNQFGAQEPGSNEQISEFCTRQKAEFPIFDKIDVNGETASPLYKFLKSSKGGLFGDKIKWNFSKFLVDRDGNVVNRYAPTTSPLSIEKDVKKVLGIS